MDLVIAFVKASWTRTSEGFRMFKATLLMATAFVGTTACAVDNEPLDTQTSALTAEQCSYFAVNGKITICHMTGSATNPYTIVRTD